MRYVILVLLNIPIILLALVNIVIQYKMKKVDANHFRHQLILWLVILVVLVISFPLYNYAEGRQLLDSSKLSLFDITQTTAIVYIVYALNNQRRRIEQNERTIRDLHQEVSIRLASKEWQK